MTGKDLEKMLQEYNEQLEKERNAVLKTVKCTVEGGQNWFDFIQKFDTGAFNMSMAICTFWRKAGYDVTIRMSDYHLFITEV